MRLRTQSLSFFFTDCVQRTTVNRPLYDITISLIIVSHTFVLPVSSAIYIISARGFLRDGQAKGNADGIGMGEGLCLHDGSRLKNMSA